jgi:2-methylcitrate dehydratase PrpD
LKPASADRDASEDLVLHAQRLRFENLPAQTIERSKLVILDTLGAALAALDAEGCPGLRELVRGWGGAPQATLIGYGGCVPAHHAAMVNGTLARALELDEVHEQALVHSAATMLPVALAAAERWGRRDGRSLITAVALGMDAGCRLSLAPTLRLGGADYVPRAISRTYTTGALAGSLVAAKLAGADLETMRNAFGVAYSQCGGNQQGLNEGVLAVRVQQGLCAAQAVLAMELAQAGVSGTRESLEGKYGYYAAYWRGDYDRRVLVDALGARFEGDRVSIKPYACCKYSHTAIAAAIEIASQPGFRLEDVERVTVRVQSTDCWELLCAPLELKSSAAELAGPNGWSLAQFSFPYVIAAALARRRLSVEELAPASRRDPAIVALLDKVEPVLEERGGQAELPEPGCVEVRFKDGRRVERIVRHAPGHPERPLEARQVIEKFLGCAARLPVQRARSLAERVLALEGERDVGELLAMTVIDA